MVEDRDGIFSRRMLLQSTVATMAAAAAVVASPKPAPATIKISKAAVGYQDHPDGDKHCEKCSQYVAPAGCKIVDGPISPEGFCRLFAPQRQAARPPGAAPVTG
jgi:hypothetical protein